MHSVNDLGRHIFAPLAKRRWWLLTAVITGSVILGAASLLRFSPEPDFRAHAEAAARTGQRDAAIIEYKNHLQRHPDDLAARRLLGRLYLDARQPSAALKELGRAARLRDKYPDIDLDLTRAYLALGDPGKGLSALKRYRGPSTPDVVALEASLQGTLGDIASARKLLETERASGVADAGLELATAKLAFAERDLEGAMAAVDRALTLKPASRDALVLKGAIALASQLPDSATQSFERVLAESPADLEALAGLTEALLMQGKAEAAAPVFEGLRKAAPRWPLLALYEGWLAHARQDWANASSALSTLLASAPGHPLALLLAADAALRQGQPAQAESLLKGFLSREPTHLPARRQLASAILQQGRAEEAAAQLEALVREHPEDAGLQTMLGQACVALGDAARADGALARAVSLAPESKLMQTQRALAQIYGGNGAEGVATLQRLAAELPEDAMSREGLALGQLLTGEASEALATARALVALRPADPHPLHLLAVAAAQAGDEEEASKALDEALRLSPGFAPALSMHGVLALRVGDLETAKTRLESALKSDRRHEPAALALATVGLAEKEPANAVKGLEAFIAGAPAAADARWMLAALRLGAGDGEAARRLADAALALEPARPASRLRWSQVYLAAGAAGPAYDALAEMRKEYGANPIVLLLYADAARATRRFTEARSAYESLTARAPSDPTPWRGLLALALTEGDTAAAERATAELRRLAPDAPDADEAVAMLALSRGEPSAALVPLEAAFAKGPATRRLLQLAEAEHAAGNPSGAKARLENWLKQHPDDMAALEAQGMMALQDNDQALAKTAFEKLLAVQPGHAVALNNLAWLYDQAGDPRALDYAERARAALPDHPATADTLGWLLVRQGQVQRGLRLIEKAVNEMKDDPSVVFHHAFALNAAGQQAAARGRVEELLERHASFPQREVAEKLLIGLRQERN